MGQRRAGQRIGVIPDIGLRQQVADGVIGEVLHRCRVLGHRRRLHAVEVVVGEGLVEVRVGIGAGQHVAEHVVGVGEVLDDVAGAGEDVHQPPGLGVEALGGDDAVAGGLLGQAQLGVARVRGPVGQPAGAGDLLLALSSRHDNHPSAATAKMAILIVAAFSSRLSRYTTAANVCRCIWNFLGYPYPYTVLRSPLINA
jgi:hypothetical protein